jgi:hypothetical protein
VQCSAPLKVVVVGRGVMSGCTRRGIGAEVITMPTRAHCSPVVVVVVVEKPLWLTVDFP